MRFIFLLLLFSPGACYQNSTSSPILKGDSGAIVVQDVQEIDSDRNVESIVSKQIDEIFDNVEVLDVSAGDAGKRDFFVKRVNRVYAVVSIVKNQFKDWVRNQISYKNAKPATVSVVGTGAVKKFVRLFGEEALTQIASNLATNSVYSTSNFTSNIKSQIKENKRDAVTPKVESFLKDMLSNLQISNLDSYNQVKSAVDVLIQTTVPKMFTELTSDNKDQKIQEFNTEVDKLYELVKKVAESIKNNSSNTWASSVEIPQPKQRTSGRKGSRSRSPQSTTT